MQSKYPKKIQVGEATIRVRFAKILDRDKECLGLWDETEMTIWIKRGQTKEQELRTFIHEVIHAMDSIYHLKVKHDLVHRFEKPVLDFILLNSKLFRR